MPLRSNTLLRRYLMPKLHQFTRCDHKVPNGTASVNDNEWMPVMITGLPPLLTDDEDDLEYDKYLEEVQSL